MSAFCTVDLVDWFESHTSRRTWVSRFPLTLPFPYVLFNIIPACPPQTVEEKRRRNRSGGKVYSVYSAVIGAHILRQDAVPVTSQC